MSERIEDFPDVEWQQPDLFNVRRARNESIEILSGNINSREGGRKKNSICINSFSVSFQTKNFHVWQGQKSFWCIIEVLFLYTISRHFRGQHSPFLHGHNEHFMQHSLTLHLAVCLTYTLHVYTSIPSAISGIKIFVDVSLQNIYHNEQCCLE